MQPTRLPLQPKRKSRHYLADEDVELAVALFARFIAIGKMLGLSQPYNLPPYFRTLFL